MPGCQQQISCQPACLHREGLSSKLHEVACKEQLRCPETYGFLEFCAVPHTSGSWLQSWSPWCVWKLLPISVSEQMSAPCSIQLAATDGITGALVFSNSFHACQTFDRNLLRLRRRISVSGSWTCLIKAQFFHDALSPFNGWLIARKSVESMAEEDNVF